MTVTTIELAGLTLSVRPEAAKYFEELDRTGDGIINRDDAPGGNKRELVRQVFDAYAVAGEIRASEIGAAQHVLELYEQSSAMANAVENVFVHADTSILSPGVRFFTPPHWRAAIDLGSQYPFAGDQARKMRTDIYETLRQFDPSGTASSAFISGSYGEPGQNPDIPPLLAPALLQIQENYGKIREKLFGIHSIELLAHDAIRDQGEQVADGLRIYLDLARTTPGTYPLFADIGMAIYL